MTDQELEQFVKESGLFSLPLSENDKKALDKLKQLGNTPNFCRLCGKPSYCFGVWIPPDDISKELGETEGKKRIVGYYLCKHCKYMPKHMTLVEESIMEEHRAYIRSLQFSN